MALGQVAARTEGDVFQGHIFWLQAAALLSPTSGVDRVIIEHDQAAGVDDVSVHYSAPGANAGGRHCRADFYQVKYHVDRRETYSSSHLCDPAFIGAKRSLMQRFHDAHLRLGGVDGWYRLYLVSNWGWASDDPIGPILRESDEGSLPSRFFTDGPGSAIGRVRESWMSHLALPSEDFEDFAERLRLGVDYLGRRGVRQWLNDRLVSVGLQAIAYDRSHNPYDSLTQQILMDGRNEFDRDTFRAMCKREGLFAAEPPPVGPPVVGIRSFMRFAERLEDECDALVCVAEHFDGRHIRDTQEWSESVAPKVRALLNDASFRIGERHLLLECHTSIAFLAGYEFDRKSGVEVFPVQKGVRKAVWKPNTGTEASPRNLPTWVEGVRSVSQGGDDVAVAVSITRDALADVQAYTAQMPSVGTLVDLRLEQFGPRSVVDADHAVALADALAEVIRRRRPRPSSTTHLFIAAPNALTFFLGQHRDALGAVQLYEFDFNGTRDGSYSPSLRLPS